MKSIITNLDPSPHPTLSPSHPSVLSVRHQRTHLLQRHQQTLFDMFDIFNAPINRKETRMLPCLPEQRQYPPVSTNIMATRLSGEPGWPIVFYLVILGTRPFSVLPFPVEYP